MHTFLFALALQVVLPIFETTGPQFTSLSLVNYSSDEAEFEVGLNAADGSVRRLKKVTVGPRQQIFVAVDQMRARPTDRLSGWVSVESLSSDFSAYMTSGDGISTITTDAVWSGSTSWHLPNVRLVKGFNEFADTDTTIAIVNRALLTASVTAELIDQAGTVRRTVELSVPPAGSKNFAISDLLLPQPSERSRFEGRLVLRSGTPIMAWQQIQRDRTRSVLRGKRLDEVPLNTNLFIPFFVMGGFSESFLNLVNPGDSVISLDIAAFDMAGDPLGERADVTIPAGGSVRSEMSSLLRLVLPPSYPKPVIVGSLQIRGIPAGPFRVLADVEVTGFDPNTGPEASMTYWASQPSAEVWEIPYMTTSPQYFTSYAITNAGATGNVRAVVEVYGRDGSVIERRAHILAPFGSANGILQPSVPGSRIRIWSYQPIVVLGALGTVDGRIIEAIPVRR
jgi:hypothetical protein